MSARAAAMANIVVAIENATRTDTEKETEGETGAGAEKGKGRGGETGAEAEIEDDIGRRRPRICAGAAGEGHIVWRVLLCSCCMSLLSIVTFDVVLGAAHPCHNPSV